MKKTSLTLVVCFVSCFAFAQSLPDFKAIKIESKEDCRAVELQVIQAANYNLSTPFSSKDVTRFQSLSFLIRWMSATPDYQFALDQTATKMMKGNDDVLGLYMAAMAKYVLENKANSKDQNLIKVNAITSVLTYAENPANNFKLSKSMKKLSEAKANNELEKALE
jgi:hypothetical protein